MEINPSLSAEILLIGAEKSRIIIVDGFADDVGKVRKAAATLDYKPDSKTSYPGVRAALPDGYVSQVLAFCEPLLRKEYEIPDSYKANVAMAYSSLLTTKGEDLSVLQRIPHCDTTRKHYYAVLHYLNEGDFGGTGFFRHKPTGFESVSGDNKDLYQQSMVSYMAVHGFPESEYVSENSGQFECYRKTDYQCNRLVIYPGHLLHTALVSEPRDVCEDPVRGRLTANVFVNFEAA